MYLISQDIRMYVGLLHGGMSRFAITILGHTMDCHWGHLNELRHPVVHGPYYGVHGMVQWTTPLVHTSTSHNPAIRPIPWTTPPLVHTSTSHNPAIHPIPWSVHGIVEWTTLLSTPVPHTIRQSVPFHSPYYGIRGIVQWTTPLVHTSTSHNPAIRPIP